ADPDNGDDENNNRHELSHIRAAVIVELKLLTQGTELKLTHMRKTECNRDQTDCVCQRVNRAQPAIAETVCGRTNRGTGANCCCCRRADQQKQADVSSAHEVILMGGRNVGLLLLICTAAEA